MKVIYDVKSRTWFYAMAVDAYKRETECSRDVAVRAIETGWPSERRE